MPPGGRVLTLLCPHVQQYVPLFLCKEDLDIAVQSAYVQRNAAQIKLYRDKADKYQADYDQVMQGWSRGGEER